MALAYGIALNGRMPVRLSVAAHFHAGDGMLHMRGKFTSEVKVVLYAAIEAIKSLESYFDAMDSTWFTTKDLAIHVTTTNDYAVGGSSYGLPLAIAIAAAMARRPISPTTCFTGGIEPGGDILPVDDIALKLRAAHVFGFKRIVLPEGQLDYSNNFINQVPVENLLGAMAGVFWE